MDKEIAYTYRDIYMIDGPGPEYIVWCTVTVYTDGTEEVTQIG
jgi:hypothetical protein